ncbi:Polymer-forming cytoskeletal [compost metagenome]
MFKFKKAGPVSIISKGMQITGKIDSANDLVIFGHIEFEKATVNDKVIYSTADVKVAVGGYVRGKIVAENVTIEGEVKGNIESSRQVRLVRGSVVSGDIYSKSLVIEEGVKFSGSIFMDEEKYSNVVTATFPVKIDVESQSFVKESPAT